MRDLIMKNYGGSKNKAVTKEIAAKAGKEEVFEAFCKKVHDMKLLVNQYTMYNFAIKYGKKIAGKAVTKKALASKRSEIFEALKELMDGENIKYSASEWDVEFLIGQSVKTVPTACGVRIANVGAEVFRKSVEMLVYVNNIKAIVLSDEEAELLELFNKALKMIRKDEKRREEYNTEVKTLNSLISSIKDDNKVKDFLKNSLANKKEEWESYEEKLSEAKDFIAKNEEEINKINTKINDYSAE